MVVLLGGHLATGMDQDQNLFPTGFQTNDTAFQPLTTVFGPDPANALLYHCKSFH